MAHLTKQQTQFIRNEINQRGISLPDLEDDLLDHICTAVEDRMASGDSFDLAFALVMNNFRQHELQKVQERTQALLKGETIYYPNLIQSAGLVVLYFVLLFMTSLIVNPVIGFHKEAIAPYITSIQGMQICICLLLVIALAKNELTVRSFAKVDIFPLTPFPYSVLVLIVPVIFLLSIWMEVLASFIPVPDNIQALIIQRHLQNPPIPVLLIIGFLWPLLSEILFRGIILKGLLRKYTPAQAIICSGLLFSISLFSPYNALSLFIMGLLCGWLFYQTQSLLPSVMTLALTQVSQLLFALVTKPTQYAQLFFWKTLAGNPILYYSMGLGSLLLTVFLLWWLKKIIARHPRFTQISLE